MQTPDASVQTLLGSPDPVERRLALKSKACGPADLRQALADEDPEVRAAAARHPALPPELIRELLAGDDRWLAAEVLSRQDLEPGDLAVALAQEDLRTLALGHPRVTPEHRERLAADPGVPEGLREAALRKNIGHITYPNFGEGHVHNPGVYYPERSFSRYWMYATRGQVPGPGVKAAVIHNQLRGRGFLDPDERRMTLVARPQVDPVGVHEEVRHRTFGPHPGGGFGASVEEYAKWRAAARAQERPTLAIMAGKRDLGTAGHEVQHGVFARLGQRYGSEARLAITCATLRRLPNELRGHASKLFGALKAGYRDPADHPEEAIAFLQNYLQDPLHRQKVHVHLRIANDVDAQRESVQRARRTWQALQRIGENLRPEDVGLPAPPPESERIAAWRDRLKKSREPGLDQLGHSQDLEAVEAAIRFLTGKPVDPAILRARLVDCDGDLVAAALDAAGLPPDSRAAVEALLGLRALGKSEPDRVPAVQPLSPEADRPAADLQEAFRSGDTEEVHLGGKHSAGTLLARDRDGNLLLVKPGSCKQSPAAGADENPATQSRREAAFSGLARAWGLGDRVPRADLVAVDGRETAVIEMLGTDWSGLARAAATDAGLSRRVLRRYLDAGELHAWAVLDYVAGNPDRHGNNILVSPDRGEVGLIDHGSAFAGPGFRPGRDRNSFVPYYLRIWGPDRGWSRLSPEQRLAALPALSREADDRLRTWVEGLTDETLAAVLHGYGIDPAPGLDRLRRLRDDCATADSCSRVVNGLWLA